MKNKSPSVLLIDELNYTLMKISDYIENAKLKKHNKHINFRVDMFEREHDILKSMANIK